MAKNARIGVIVGSLRAGSYSRKLAKALISRAPSLWSAVLIDIGDLPLYNQDLDATPPAAWTTFRAAVCSCDALIFVTPEYNRSIPGALKNATDIGSRPEGHNIFNSLPAAVVSTSPYAGGGMAANHALRQTFVYLNLLVMQQPEAYIRHADRLIDQNGEVTDEDADRQLRAFMSAFERWVGRVGGTVPESFGRFMERREAISNAFINGDVGPLEAISSEQEPATFFPPTGNCIRGARQVIAANREGAEAFSKGSTGQFEVLASDAGRDFAYWTGIQHANARLKGRDMPLSMKLRTTEIFRNEGGTWRLIHRHADMIEEGEIKSGAPNRRDHRASS